MLSSIIKKFKTRINKLCLQYIVISIKIILIFTFIIIQLNFRSFSMLIVIEQTLLAIVVLVVYYNRLNYKFFEVAIIVRLDSICCRMRASYLLAMLCFFESSVNRSSL